jgi:formylglycine-generating enzyme required for sulfatase activity
MSRALPVIALALAASAVAACSGGGATEGAPTSASSAIAPAGTVLEAAENEAAPATSSSARAAEKDIVAIPAGTLTAGSTPGDPGRDPTLEPPQLAIELGAFDIDRDLFPNRPGEPPLLGLSRDAAAKRCAERGRRLCTEVEWERACKGPENDAYAGRAAWNPACATAPADCPSGFGVLGMGAAVREWTASDVAPVDEVVAGAAAVRGARGEASATDHRCAKRAAVDPKAGAGDIGFRCCGGEAPSATIPSPTWKPTFRRVDLPAAKLGEMLRSVPQLRSLVGEVKYFDEGGASKAVLARAEVEQPPANVNLTTSPLLWNPVPGEEILVVTGSAGDDAFIVAFYRLPGERHRIGSSLVLRKEKGPIALGFNGYVKRRLQWATCWDCPGEWGNIVYRDENRVVITQE